MILLLLACNGQKGTETQKPPTLADFAGTPANLLMVAPLEDPAGQTRMLLISDDQWEIRTGDFWEDGELGNHWSYSLEDVGLRVGSDLLLPAGLKVGSTEESAKIVGDGAFETWYGTFPDTRQVEIADGAWTGTIVFARGVGPIRYSRGGDWDLVYYEYDWAPRGSGRDTGGDSGTTGGDSGTTGGDSGTTGVDTG